MHYMLDSDTLILMIRGHKASERRPARRERARKLVARCRREQALGNIVGISAITVSELEYGARNSERYDEEIATVQQILTPFELLDFDSLDCAFHYGRIRRDLERAGQSIGAMDLLIAAHALALSMTLVSDNQSHFQRVSGLKTVRWP
jgi:tRNA(fMet)-specific endonuclease VapC